MDRQAKTMVFVDSITAMAANKAHIRLCAILAARGYIDNSDVEAMRHLHLHDFDGVAAAEGTPAPERAALEEVRDMLDSAWNLANQVPLSGVVQKP